MNIQTADHSDAVRWNEFVTGQKAAAVFHRFEWKQVISNAYGHNAYYLMAVSENGDISGVLPLVHIRHFLFGSSLTSIPFFDTGGVLAADDRAIEPLLSQACAIADQLGVDHIELRHPQPLSIQETESRYSHWSVDSSVRIRKSRMILELPETADALIKSFKSKLRSQIKKPIKEGLTSTIGGIELIDAFYEIFAINMRDLGSPVHSKRLIREVLKAFPETARIVIVFHQQIPLACSLIIGFDKMLSNPWASSLKEYSRLSPNMLLYWTMLEYACTHGFHWFDFGRSTPDEGTYKFKEQWGAKPVDLHWLFLSRSNRPVKPVTSDRSRFDILIQYWKKLPVAVTKLVGPRIRKYIPL